MSRVQDYFETDKQVDSKRVAIHGVSRLGKTVTWAAAHDQRFAAVIASCGGEGGAALSRRDYGETIAHLVAPSRYPYQFSKNYDNYAGFPDEAPFDAHMLLARSPLAPCCFRREIPITGPTQRASSSRWSRPVRSTECWASRISAPTCGLRRRHRFLRTASTTTCMTAVTAWCQAITRSTFNS